MGDEVKFSIVVDNVPESEEKLNRAASEFADSFHLDVRQGRQILKSAPIRFINDLTRGEVSDIKGKLLELSEGSELEFRITSASLESLPSVVWNQKPTFKNLDNGEVLPGFSLDLNGSALICPNCEETFFVKRLGQDVPVADTVREQVGTEETQGEDIEVPDVEEEEPVEEADEIADVDDIEEIEEIEDVEEIEEVDEESEEQELDEDEDLDDLDEEIEALEDEDEDLAEIESEIEELEQEEEEESVASVDGIEEVDEEENLDDELAEIESEIGDIDDLEDLEEEDAEDIGEIEEIDDIEELEDVEEIEGMDEVEEIEDVSASLDDEESAGVSSNGESSSDEVCNVFISSINGDDQRDRAVKLLARIRNCTKDEAEELTQRPIVPVAKGVTEERAHEIEEEFDDAGLTVNITRRG